MDEAYRQAQREAQSGDIETQTRYLQMRRRAGEINDDQLWVAGLLGDDAAAQIMGMNPVHVAETVPDMLASWRLLRTDDQWALFLAAMRALGTQLAQILTEEAEQLRSGAPLESQQTQLALQDAADYIQNGANILNTVAAYSFRGKSFWVHEDEVAQMWLRAGSSIISIPVQKHYRTRITRELQQLAIQRVYAERPGKFCRC